MAKSRERAATELLDAFDSPFLHALTERARLELLKVLMLHGPLDVSTLASHLPQERSVVSRHLKILESAGIVRITRDGKHRHVSIDGARFLSELQSIAELVQKHASTCCPPEPPLVALRSRR